MEYLRINENKLKITLTREELHFYGMDLANLSYSSTETRRAFWAILDDAKHATGFDAAASRVSVQIFASRAGGCEMYVIGIPKDGESAADTADAITDLLQTDDHEADAASLLPLPARSSERQTELTVRPASSHRFAGSNCEFTQLSDLLDACTALSAGGYDGESSAWWMNDRYYLSLSGNCGATSRRSSRLTASGMIREFGTPLQELDLTYLAEHGKCLCKNDAVDQLAKLAT